ncbi:lipid II flippase MurJ [Lysinibacter sp. HNR]|uniref:murein biosynthesis integral membrane protein MurJ n=1 Tax=Lysinibacter sp. HNR TaxID=3031408 RepID=UPI002435370D|nr:lipid II flippase MurJ [Lysinibacter sp. HNR]WGD37334.1 lipid II flippase MurJ [Lysinibacter sp. HNR]
MSSRPDNIGRATMWLASGTIVSRITGFISAAVLARTIGITGLGADAFTLANSLPNNLYTLIAGGVLNAVLVPQIVRAATRGDDGGAGFINKLVTLSIVILGIATTLLTLATPVVVSMYGITKLNTPVMDVAIGFGFWCMPQVFFYGLYTVLGEVLNARKMFGPFTWAPILNNVVAIAGMILFTHLFGSVPMDPAGEELFWGLPKIAVLAGTATLGVMAQALILIFFWKRAGLKFRFDFGWRGVGFRAVGRMSGGAMGIMIAGQIAYIITTNVVMGSSASENASTTALKYGYLIFVLPHSIITVSITTAHLTRTSEYAALNNLVAVRNEFSEIMRSVLLPIVLAMFGVIVLANPIARVFAGDNPAKAETLALVIVGYMIGLLFFTIIFVVQRTFYALSNTHTPLIFFIIQYSLQSILVILTGIFVDKQYLAFGASLTQGIAMMITAPIALYWLGKRLGVGLDGKNLTRSISLFIGAGIVASAAGYTLNTMMGGNTFEGFSSSSTGWVLSMAIVTVVMTVIYLGILMLFRSPDLKKMLAPILRRIGR